MTVRYIYSSEREGKNDMGLLEKQLERQITLLYLLNIESSNISELARKLNITDKTITADIDHFNVFAFLHILESIIIKKHL